jgi:hypothetical protein
MTNFKIEIHDVNTGEIVRRDLTEAELATAQADKLKADQEAEAIAKDRADKEATRAAVLTRLGLTSDELLALLS